MAGRASLVRAEPGFSLPFFDRLAPAPPPALVAARLEAHSGPGDIVLDLAGRGGWIAHAAIDRQRRAVSVESSPLSRLLAELVLRPPDLRHLDAAFQAMSASPRRQSSLKVAVGDLFATRCATCERMLVADEFIWPGSADADADADREGDADRAADARQAPSRKHYRCPVCRGQRGGSEQRTAPLDDDDLERARTTPEGADIARGRLWDRFPVVEGAEALVDTLLELHTPRQLIGLEAILERIEGDLRAAPIEAALRLALLHALLPASRLNGFPGRIATLRIQGGRVRPPGSGGWRERNPWLAFEDGMRLVRGFIQRLEGGPYGSVQARLGEDLRSLADGTATAVLGVAGPSAARILGVGPAGAADRGASGGGASPSSSGLGSGVARGRVRLVLGQPPVRPNQERLSLAYWATAWVLGRDAASILPIEALSGGAIRAPWGWQASALGRSLATVEPAIARDGRVVFLVDSGGAEGLVAAALGGVQAGFRLVRARLEDGDEELTGTIELIPPGAVAPPGPRTRGNQPLDALAGGAGDPDMVPGPGLFVGPERFDRRPFSQSDAARTVADVAVETIKARGEPARYERVLGEILVGLDRAGQLRRLLAADAGEGDAADDGDAAGGIAMGPGLDAPEPGRPSRRHTDPPSPAGQPAGQPARDPAPAAPAPLASTTRSASVQPAASDKVDRLLDLIRGELSRTDHRRLREIEPGRWWLAEREDIAAAAAPLADRVEWAVYSLLSTAGPLAESSFFERVAALFTGHDLPDEALVRACLQSYRSRASTADRVVTGDDLLGRAQQHAEMIAHLADGGHRLGMSVWIGRREQARKLGSRRLGDWLDEREQRAYLAHVSRAVDDLAEVDCVWYVRGRAAFLFEVEWTAMLGEPLLKRGSRIPQEESIVRFLVVAPERTELVRHKIERSPLVREAMERDNWHILKWNHARAFLDREDTGLGDLEPFLGLDPLVERSGEQMPLFED